jgi:uncharacterized membrane protein
VTNNDQLDVLIAVYLIPELAREDYDSFVKLAGEGAISTDGVVLVTKDADGNVAVKETGDHMGRKGVKAGGGVGLVVGLFAPPLLAATAIGSAAGGIVGKVARKRVTAGIADKMDQALPPGTAGIISVYDHDHADIAAGALTNAIRASIVQIDKASAKELKQGLEQASAGLAS